MFLENKFYILCRKVINIVTKIKEHTKMNLLEKIQAKLQLLIKKKKMRQPCISDQE